ncbi:MAG: cysteine hydrolase [Xanthobacteraceae bacterium]|nr:cysteine hydrolase [Xanthobacteraceae bacterium]
MPTAIIHAEPSELSFQTETAAVLVIDMQNDFGAAGGMFDRAGIDISGIQRATAPTSRVVDRARAAGLKIVFVKMAFMPDLSDTGGENSPTWIKHVPLQVGKTVRAPNGEASRILVRDTWNTDILDQLTPRAGDIVLYKNRFSAFFKTALDHTLREHGIRTLVVVGCTTSVCVEASIRDAAALDYTCVLLRDCSAEPIGQGFARSNHDASLHVIGTMFGWVSDSSCFMAALQGARLETAAL